MLHMYMYNKYVAKTLSVYLYQNIDIYYKNMYVRMY